MVTGIHSPALTTSWYPTWTVRVTPSAATAPTDAPARPVTVSKAARAIRAGRRQRRWACIYCTKTAAEGKSSVLASSAAVWRGAGPPSIGRGRARPRKWTDSDGLARPTACVRSAGGGTRTHTDLRPGAFEAPSSTIPTLRRAGHCLKRLKRSHRTDVSNARMAPSATRVGRRPERGSRRPAGRGRVYPEYARWELIRDGCV